MITYISTPDYYNDYIAHYGVKGMRWGVRKRQLISGGKSRRRVRKKIKSIIKSRNDAIRKYRTAYDKASNMSDRADEQKRIAKDQWRIAKDLYKNTGITRVGRIINNAAYDINQIKKKKKKS